MKRYLIIVILGMVIGAVLGCTRSQTQAPVQTEAFMQCEGKAVTFGEISDDPNEVKASRQPFANYIAGQLASFGIECGRVRVVDSADEMSTLIKNGEVDIYMDSIYPAMLLSQATGAEPILRRWRNCDPEYYSILFAAADSGITSLEELPGHMVAMDQVYSTSGFALPAVYLIDQGYKLAIKDSFSDPVNADEIGIYFSMDDKNTLNLVREGKVIAGATDDYYFSKWQAEAPGTLIKLAETAAVPRQIVLVRSDIDQELRNAIINELTTAHLNQVGLSAMEHDAGTCKYDDPPLGIEATLNQMQEMHNKIMEITGWQEATSGNQ